MVRRPTGRMDGLFRRERSRGIDAVRRLVEDHRVDIGGVRRGPGVGGEGIGTGLMSGIVIARGVIRLVVVRRLDEGGVRVAVARLDGRVRQGLGEVGGGGVRVFLVMGVEVGVGVGRGPEGEEKLRGVGVLLSALAVLRLQMLRIEYGSM